MRTNIFFASFLMLEACGSSPVSTKPAAQTASDDTALAAAVANPARPAEDRARDAARHPKETLSFFGVRPDSKVIELWPGGGWYTAVLGPLLGANGSLTVTSFDPKGPPDAYGTKNALKLQARHAGDPASFGKVNVQIVNPPDMLQLGPDATADVVLTFRNYHNWMEAGYADKIVAAAFKALRPGGVFGVEEHRAAPGTTPEQSVKSGYVDQAVIVKAAEAAGFKLVASSEINANPKDTKDYPEGVWTLPPSLALEAADRAKYEAIGESDRMTLKFEKPASAN
jgi:predicted methyltransferase